MPQPTGTVSPTSRSALAAIGERPPRAPDAVRPELLVELDGLKVLRLDLDRGQRMHTHDHPGCNVMIQCLYGRAAVVLDGERVPMTQGQLLCFDGASSVSPGSDDASGCGLLITLAG